MAMETQTTSMEAGPDQGSLKFSRYRSVRRAATQKQPKQLNTSIPPAPSLPSAPATGLHYGTTPTADSINRSMSRYRRQRAPTAPAMAAQPAAPALPTHKTQLNGHDPLRIPEQQAVAATAAHVPAMARSMTEPTKTTTNPFSDNAAATEDSEAERERHRQEAMARLTGETIKPAPAVSDHRRVTPRTAEGRRRHDDVQEGSRRHHRSDEASEPKRRSLKDKMKLVKPKDRSNTESSAVKSPEPPTGNHFTGVDAPISAVNSGKRSVLVQYGRMSTKMPVMPSTRVHDLLVAASACLTSEIDPPRFIMMESFSQLGLERPLRRYEYVRDILNSWAYDGENALIIVPAASIESLRPLEAQNVPIAPPADVTVHIYYSQRPRKWDKRFVTLRSDGQVTVSKKEHGKDQMNACHLSDFDVYSPTPDFLKKNVDPPKKICQAIKSQQKSSMFLSTENFVNFFSTNDRAVAEQWHQAVQTWRSWYLVHKKGAAQSEDDEEAKSLHQQRVGSSHSKSSHPPQFKPLVDLESVAEQERASSQHSSPDDQQKSSKTKDIFSRPRRSRERGPPPSSFPKSLAESDTATQPTDGSPFASSGLLGRTYTQRQQAMKEREEREKRANEEPFIAHGLVGSMCTRRGPVSQPASRSNTMTSSQAPDMGTGAVKRSLSVNRSKPLVDLTPVYQEPPQHARKGRGVAVEPGVPLIDAATGPEPVGGAIPIPPSTTWRRPPVPPEPLSTTETQTRKRSNTIRSTSNQRHQHTAPASPASPVDNAQPSEGPFLANSLLARSAQLAVAQSSVPVGHGVATGDRNASKPMLDLTPPNPFAEGSLLRNL
ncbi:hypothetical protein KXW98_005728 [Aspergillus fumigatus]|nr:hypothetical protein KXX22_001081 [Aspergillus fumigatus]KAH1572054.1 hypothetical protein KXX28_006686 [Aspergillus fumigatus]KAH1645337.1 hypothetical protein KXX59_008524 [Aspergillus fumigatus]KAH1711367.1 hypothetical protein KXX23_007062 [Aspergillus fumigatus]KAH1729860.1 hypothetical protein KXX25_007383 [Aspergillus fumigatus]